MKLASERLFPGAVFLGSGQQESCSEQHTWLEKPRALLLVNRCTPYAELSAPNTRGAPPEHNVTCPASTPSYGPAFCRLLYHPDQGNSVPTSSGLFILDFSVRGHFHSCKHILSTYYVPDLRGTKRKKMGEIPPLKQKREKNDKKTITSWCVTCYTREPDP